VVTARFITREVNTIARVEILGPDGKIETIEGTTIHPIWSDDRQDWVPLGELLPGETLRAANGAAIVLSLTMASVALPVYNIEIHGEHVYQVGELGLLVHNSCLISTSQLQSKFKHAADFGIAGTPNKGNLQAFASAIQRHVGDSSTQLIQGTYRGNPVNIHVNPQTGLAVLTDVGNNFISGWRLSAQQLLHVLNGGKLGGG
jgi:hypothetical protein